jgi:hypothetical protein
MALQKKGEGGDNRPHTSAYITVMKQGINLVHLTTVHPNDEAAQEEKFIQLEYLGAPHQHSSNYTQ